MGQDMRSIRKKGGGGLQKLNRIHRTSFTNQPIANRTIPTGTTEKGVT